MYMYVVTYSSWIVMVAVNHEHWYRYIVVWIFVVHYRKSEETVTMYMYCLLSIPPTTAYMNKHEIFMINCVIFMALNNIILTYMYVCAYTL